MLAPNSKYLLTAWVCFVKHQKLKMLSPLKLSRHILPLVGNDLFFLGDMEKSDELILSISCGLVHPMTHESYAWEDIYAELAKETSPDLLTPKPSGPISTKTSQPTTNGDLDQAPGVSSYSPKKRGSAISTDFDRSEQIKKQKIKGQF